MNKVISENFRRGEFMSHFFECVNEGTKVGLFGKEIGDAVSVYVIVTF